jgi:hypothetical protein
MKIGGHVQRADQGVFLQFCDVSGGWELNL